MVANMKHSLTSFGTVRSGRVFRCRRQELDCLSVLQTYLENVIGATSLAQENSRMGAV